MLPDYFLYVTGLSGRYKSRSKQASERSRTPGRQTPPENRSPQVSPRDESPQEDEVFIQEIETVEKKPESNSNSNEATLLDQANPSDETLIVTEMRKCKGDNRNRRNKSARNSRASTPGPSGDVGNDDEQQTMAAPEIIEEAPTPPIQKEKTPELLDIPKSKEKSPSPIRHQNSHLDIEEPSFANTLDDIATMGTNEVADIDAYLDDRPTSALPVYLDDIQQFIPTARYVEPVSDKEENEQHENIEEKISADAGDIMNSMEEKIHKVESEEEKEELKENNIEHVINAPINEVSYQAIVETQEEELKDLIIEDLKNEQHADIQKVESPFINPEEKLSVVNPSVIESSIEAPESTNESELKNLEESNKIQEVQFSSNGGSLEDINIRRSSSHGSSGGMSGLQQDRQFTPLSFSSSDAAFYSPADSPEESLSEKLRDRPSGSQSQVKVKIFQFWFDTEITKNIFQRPSLVLAFKVISHN